MEKPLPGTNAPPTANAIIAVRFLGKEANLCTFIHTNDIYFGTKKNFEVKKRKKMGVEKDVIKNSVTISQITSKISAFTCQPLPANQVRALVTPPRQQITPMNYNSNKKLQE